MVDREMPKQCEKCGCATLRQDEDVLDTWFSSWLWPFSVFGWPEDTTDVKRFYPTSSLVTGPDIIFFWVARMIMAGLEFKGDIPFRNVYFTSIIRDDQGRKLSKSLMNSPDPLDVIATYGADALRFTITYIAPVGQDIRYSNEKCELGRNFTTKLWNVGRFRLRQGALSGQWRDVRDIGGDQLRLDERWILARTNAVIGSVTGALERFDFHEFSHTLYEFVWNEFCDWYLESAKSVFSAPDRVQERETVLRVFDHVFGVILRLLHPVMPFVTEELFQQMGFIGPEASIMTDVWPTAVDASQLTAWGATREPMTFVENKFALVTGVRNVKANYRIPLTTRVDVLFTPASPTIAAFLAEDVDAFRAMAFVGDLRIDGGGENSPVHGPSAMVVSSLGTARIPLAGLIDVDAEVGRLQKQQKELAAYAAAVRGKLANAGFVSRAPAAVVEGERGKLSDTEAQLQRIAVQLQAMEQSR